MHNGHYFFFVSIVKTIVSIVVKHKPPIFTARVAKGFARDATKL